MTYYYYYYQVINASYDPFIEEASLPRESDLSAISPVRLMYHDHGGHCGFNTNLTGAPDPNLVLPSHGDEFIFTVCLFVCMYVMYVCTVYVCMYVLYI